MRSNLYPISRMAALTWLGLGLALGLGLGLGPGPGLGLGIGLGVGLVPGLGLGLVLMAALTHVIVEPMETMARAGARKFPVKMSRMT